MHPDREHLKLVATRLDPALWAAVGDDVKRFGLTREQFVDRALRVYRGVVRVERGLDEGARPRAG